MLSVWWWLGVVDPDLVEREGESSPSHLLTPFGAGPEGGWGRGPGRGVGSWRLEPGQPLSQAPWDPFQVAASRLGQLGGGGKGRGSLFPSKGSRVSLPEPPPPCSGQPLIPLCQSWRYLLPTKGSKATGLYVPPPPHLEVILMLVVGVDGDPWHRPSGPESPSLKVLITGVAEDLSAVAAFMYSLLPTPTSLCIHARPWICNLGYSNSGAFFLKINLFIYGCTGSSLLCTGFLKLGPVTALSLRCKGFSLW